MKKILTRIFSAALAAALVLPASAAAPQLATKAKSATALSEQRGVAQQALSSPQLQLKGLTPLKARSAQSSLSNGLSRQKTSGVVKRADNKPFKMLKEAGEMPDLIGGLLYSDDQTLTTGLYTVPRNAEDQPELIIDGVNAKNGGVLVGQTYYATNYIDLFGFIFIYVNAYDLETGDELFEIMPDGLDAILFTATYDATTDNIYAIGYQASGQGIQLAKVEYSESAVNVTPISPIDFNVNTLTVDSEGQLYAITYTASSSSLVKIDKTTGEKTEIGETGEIPQYLSGGTIDTKTNTFYWTVCPPDETGWMTTVDLTTGAATRLYQFANNEEIVGVQIRQPLAEEKAPAAPTDLELNFVNGALTGEVSFSIPATCFDGTALTGDVTYTVLANGEQVTTATAAAGSDVTVNATVEEPGDYTFTVYTTNSVGNSPKTRASMFIGNGVPKAPKPVLAYADGTFTLTWEAVTESADGGYIDAAAVTYTVYDSEGEVVAENIAATEWTTEQAETEQITNFQYSVTAKCNDLVSAAGKSNVVVLGAVIPPYTNTFDELEDCADFIVIDANNDGLAWTYYQGAMRIQWNSSMPMDDWLISAPMKVEAGKAYYVSFDMKGQSAGYAEKFEAFWGTDASADAMTNEIVPLTEIKSNVYATYGGYVTPDADGKIFIGIHACSEKDTYYLFIDNFSVAAGINASAPGQVSDLVVTPASYGALFTSITFNAPTTTVGGAALTSIDKIEVARDGEVIATKTNVEPGAAVKVADALDTFGYYTYSVTAYNAEGAGQPATTEVYVGISAPTKPTDLKVEVVGNEVVLTWNAPAEDIKGNPLAPAQVSYVFCTYDGTDFIPTAEGITETTYTHTLGELTEQDFEEYGIAAVTEGGESTVAVSDLIAVGPAYTNYHETFANGGLSYILGTSSAGGGAWGLYTEESLGVPDANGDTGFAAMKAQYLDYYATLFTGVISLENVANPALTFYTYVINGDNPDINEIEVAVCAPNSYDWKTLKTFVVSDLGSEGWVKATVPLHEYAGQDIQIQFTATTKQYVYTMIDDIQISSMLDYDLKVKAISAPAKVQAGNDFAVNVTVANEGGKEASSYTVKLYGLTASGYAEVDTKTGEALAPESTATFEFTQTVPVLATASDEYIYYAEVVFDLDENAENNTSDAISVKPVVSKLPAASELKGEATNEGNVLTWNEPDLTAGVPEATTDDFEDAESWAHEYSDWIFVDVDEAEVGGFQGSDLPGITPGETKSSWFVFDASGEQFNQTFAAASGDKYLACLFRWDDGTVDDWAISPALNGCAQTISFKAKSYSTQYPDAFEIWISTGSTAVNDFTLLEGSHKNVNTAEWTDYSFDLPEGTKRFAIRSCATSSFMLMLDDVTYIPGDGVADLTLVGYDVYRNGEKLNEEVIAETTYTDADAPKGEKVAYNVVAIYTTGASAPSNTLELTTSGLDSIFATVGIAAGKGEVIVTGAEGLAVQIVAVDGKVIFSGVADAKTTVDVLPGVYVVKAGEKVAKLLVR